MPDFTRDEYDDKVFPAAAVEETEAFNMNDLRKACARMKEVQGTKVRLEEELAEVNKEFDRIRLNEIPQMMESLGVKNATFDGLGRVQLATDLYASTREGKKNDAIQWLRDCGYASMITETYNASSIKAVFRSMIKEGTMPPDDIFSVTPFIRASIVAK